MKIDITNTNEKYDIIYADPPWAYLWGTGKTGGNFAPEKHYKTMSTDEICQLGEYIKKIREKNSALFTWVKTKKDGMPLAGMGSYTKANAELCLLAMRGHIKSIDKTVPQILMHPRIGHSVKPDEIMRRIERLFGPNTTKIELFARREVDGWDRWGDEA